MRVGSISPADPKEYPSVMVMHPYPHAVCFHRAYVDLLIEEGEISREDGQLKADCTASWLNYIISDRSRP